MKYFKNLRKKRTQGRRIRVDAENRNMKTTAFPTEMS